MDVTRVKEFAATIDEYAQARDYPPLNDSEKWFAEQVGYSILHCVQPSDELVQDMCRQTVNECKVSFSKYRRVIELIRTHYRDKEWTRTVTRQPATQTAVGGIFNA